MTATFLLILFTAPQSDWSERQWSAHIAQQIGGETEVRTPDGSRADVVTATHAWEVEWARKWQQSIGQSVFYGLALNRKPGVILLMKADDRRFYLRALAVCAKLDIELRTRRVP